MNASALLNSPAFAWSALLVAGLLEVVWSVAMKASKGFTVWPATTLCLAAAWASFALLGLAMRQLPLGTAYAVWTGIGAIGAALLGMLWFKEPTTAARLACIGLILAGIVGLKLLGDRP
ncbi:multidrug efflux SMR transporter [Roseateles sp. DAIF2]|uniref:DMT family transporter n=1 Tax=Roseateles sp. DAIF2 TaxID=2714952 RepID=UPI0018A33BB3|nr:multidrug efflux SMR transporter [Roseateles sp. DAIF2]QPF73822.1 multidrug efflux SMR transporter [Roseateles sp. DAIF2]